MSDAAEALLHLAGDPAFAALDRWRRPLSVLRVLGKARDELAHSRMLAALFDDETSVLAHPLWSALMGFDPVGRVLQNAATKTWRSVRAHREVDRVDVTIEAVADDGTKVALGIENKVDASEHGDQVARYRRSLAERYANMPAALMFLTPTGREPKAKGVDGVPVIAVAYRTLVNVMVDVAQDDGLPRRDRRVLEEFLEHVEDEMGDGSDVRALVRDLCARHPNAVALMRQHAPTLNDAVEPLLAMLRRATGATDLEHDCFPSRGEAREIKVTLGSWRASGIPFTVMLHVGCLDNEPRAAVRLWLHQDEHVAHRDRLEAWAKTVNASGGICGAMVDPEFLVVRGWEVWRRVLREDNHPPECFVASSVYDRDLIPNAARRAAEYVSAVSRFSKL